MSILETDLSGVWTICKHSKVCQLILLLGICGILYYILSKYTNIMKNNFYNINNPYGYGYDNRGGGGGGSQYYNDNINLKNATLSDEDIIRNLIKLPNSNPAMLTSDMIFPIPSSPKYDEDKRKTRMDVLNMFYNTFDDDVISINNRPQNLYVIP